MGKTLQNQAVTDEIVPGFYSVKEAVFPFIKFAGVDPVLGPEMKSTGEVMGVGKTFGAAFAKAQAGAGSRLPMRGRAFISVRREDHAAAVDVARDLAAHGFNIVATRGTAATLRAAGIACDVVNKVIEGRPHIVDMIKNEDIDLIINTTSGNRQSLSDSSAIRREALQRKVTYFTTIAGARATCQALKHMNEPLDVNRLQDLHADLISTH